MQHIHHRSNSSQVTDLKWCCNCPTDRHTMPFPVKWGRRAGCDYYNVPGTMFLPICTHNWLNALPVLRPSPLGFWGSLSTLLPCCQVPGCGCTPISVISHGRIFNKTLKTSNKATFSVLVNHHGDSSAEFNTQNIQRFWATHRIHCPAW